MKCKRGQVTVFIIISLMIIVTISLFFVFPREASQEFNFIESESVQVQLQECINLSAVLSLVDSGEHGGEYNFSGTYVLSEPYLTPLVIDGTKTVITLDEFEINLNLNFADYMVSCVEQLDFGANVEVFVHEVKATSKILEDSVVFDVYMPTTVSKTDSDTKDFFEDFSFTAESIYLPSIIEVFDWFYSQRVLYPSSVCLTCLGEKMNQTGFEIDIYESDDISQMVYVLSDSRTNFIGEPYHFVFGVEFE